MRSKRMHPAAVPPAAAILVSLPAGPFWKLPEAAVVVKVSVAVPVPPDVKATLVGEIVAFMDWTTELDELAVMLAVPAYPPVDVRVMVEVPLLFGLGDEMVTLVAVTVMLGLLTVTFVVPEEPALYVSPP
jgi:hypothetical protein